MTCWEVCLTHDPRYGGIHRSVNEFAVALDGSILSFDDGAADRSWLREPRPVLRVASRPRPFNRACHWVTPSMAAEAAEAVAGADLLMVHSLFRGHAPWAARWCRAHGRPYLSVLEGCLDPWGLRKNGFAKRAWLRLYGQRFFGDAGRIVAATGRERDKALAWVPADRSVVIHWPVPLPPPSGREAARATFREAHRIPEEARTLLFVGRLHPMKRPAPMIEAFLRAGVPTCHLVVVGMEEGVTMAGLRALVPREAATRIHVVGPLAGDALAAAYHAADGFISLSHRENFGYAFAEAMAHGLPVIVSPGHDLAHDVGRDERTGFPCGWLLPADSAAATAAISAFAEASLRRLAAMGAAGRAWASDNLSVERFRTELRRLTAEVVR
jgi:glycosyltransferase involved in cell wall biosynthesis